MSSPLTCPVCAASFRLAEDMRGQRLFCPKCAAALVMTAAGTVKRDEGGGGAPAPAARARDGKNLLLLVLVGLLLLVGGIAVGLYLSRDRRDDQQPLAKGSQEPGAAEKKLRKLPPEKEPGELPKQDPQKVASDPKTPDGPRSGKAQEVDDKAKQAHFILPLAGLGKGGRLADVKGIYLEGKTHPSNDPKAQLDFPFTLTWDFGGKVRCELRFPDALVTDDTRPPAAGQPNYLWVFDGERAWNRVGPRTFDLKAEDFRRTSMPLGGPFGLGGKDLLTGQDVHLSIVGDSSVKGQAAICVKPDREPSWVEGTKLYFDRETRLLVKSEARTLFQWSPQGLQAVEGKPLVEHYYSDYRETEGVKWPGQTEIYTNGAASGSTEYTSLRLLRAVDETLFRRP